jgi:hypothetical protein
VHSYYAEPADPAMVAGFTHYPFAFTCAVARDNVFAVQFHPEKSQAAGLRLLANFITGKAIKGKAMLIIPAIDLKDGQCVRLKQGEMDSATVFSANPAEMAGKWLANGAGACIWST